MGPDSQDCLSQFPPALANQLLGAPHNAVTALMTTTPLLQDKDEDLHQVIVQPFITKMNNEKNCTIAKTPLLPKGIRVLQNVSCSGSALMFEISFDTGKITDYLLQNIAIMLPP